jgi:hypothetical protein
MRESILLRLLFILISLCISSIVFLSPNAMSTPPRVEHNVKFLPPTIIQVITMSLPSQIFRRWTHSREEDQGDILVYRSDNYQFPPARGREGLEFREDGEFIQYRIGSTDRDLAVSGRWSLQETNTVEVHLSNQTTSSYTLRILECDEQILKVNKIN